MGQQIVLIIFALD